MSTKKKTKLPNEGQWKKWGVELFTPWFNRNNPTDIRLPVSDWKHWGETFYLPWYELHKPGVITAESNPTDPPPPPPGPIKP